LIQENRTIRFI